MEDLFNRGKFTIELHEGDSLGIVVSTDDPVNKDARELLQIEEERRRDLIKGQSGDEITQEYECEEQRPGND